MFQKEIKKFTFVKWGGVRSEFLIEFVNNKANVGTPLFEYLTDFFNNKADDPTVDIVADLSLYIEDSKGGVPVILIDRDYLVRSFRGQVDHATEYNIEHFAWVSFTSCPSKGKFFSFNGIMRNVSGPRSESARSKEQLVSALVAKARHTIAGGGPGPVRSTFRVVTVDATIDSITSGNTDVFAFPEVLAPFLKCGDYLFLVGTTVSARLIVGDICKSLSDVTGTVLGIFYPQPTLYVKLSFSGERVVTKGIEPHDFVCGRTVELCPIGKDGAKYLDHAVTSDTLVIPRSGVDFSAPGTEVVVKAQNGIVKRMLVSERYFRNIEELVDNNTCTAIGPFAMPNPIEFYKNIFPGLGGVSVVETVVFRTKAQPIGVVPPGSDGPVCVKGRDTGNCFCQNFIFTKVDAGWKTKFTVLDAISSEEAEAILGGGMVDKTLNLSLKNQEVAQTRKFFDALSFRLKELSGASSDDTCNNWVSNPHCREGFTNNLDFRLPIEFKQPDTSPSVDLELNMEGPSCDGCYLKYKDKPKSVIHYGQRKCLISKVWFISKCQGLSAKLIVYVGAAPGYHLELLIAMYPQYLIHAYDPREMMVQNKNLKHFRKRFGDEDLARYAGVDILFISDIRSFEKGMCQVGWDNAIISDHQRQLCWMVALEPQASLVKFRLSYRPGATKMFVGEALCQPWAGVSSTETRYMVTDLKSPMVTYDHQSYQDFLAFHNRVVRPALHDGGVAPNHDRCYDCVAEYTILEGAGFDPIEWVGKIDQQCGYRY